MFLRVRFTSSREFERVNSVEFVHLNDPGLTKVGEQRFNLIVGLVQSSREVSS